jgi:hypothetical protein
LTKNKVNIIALVAGISTLLLIAVSVFVPWWQFTVGRPAIAQLNFSPVNFNVALLGNSITVPLILALNIACLLTLLSGGIVMLIYSLTATKPYSKRLLGFAYKKPLYAVIFFVLELIVLSVLVKLISGLNLSLFGPSTLQLPPNIAPSGVSISVSVLGAFEWPFYLAAVAAGLCVAARLYHRKITANAVTPILPQPQ